jgi:hypothetical protein
MYGGSASKILIGPAADAGGKKVVENSPNTFAQSQMAGLGPADYAEKVLEKQVNDREALFQQGLRQRYPLAFLPKQNVSPLEIAFIEEAQQKKPRSIS